MKKTLLVLSTILAMSMIFIGCQKDPETKGDDKSIPASAPDAGTADPEETPDVKEDLVIFDTAQTFTTAGYDTKYEFSSDIDITGYKYIKVELSSENPDGNKVAVQFMDPDWKMCGLIVSEELDSNVVTLYTDCGTNFWEDTDYNGTGDKQSTSTKLKTVQVYAQQTVDPWGTVNGVNVTINKITLTNTK